MRNRKNLLFFQTLMLRYIKNTHKGDPAMEWLLTVLIATSLETTPAPVIRAEHLSPIDTLEECLAIGFYTRAKLLQPGFRLPDEPAWFHQAVNRQVIVLCHQVWSI